MKRRPDSGFLASIGRKFVGAAGKMAQAFGTKRRSESAEGTLSLAMVSGFFARGFAPLLLLQQFDQFLGRRPPQQIHLDKFHLPLAGTTTAVILKEQRRDQRQVELEGHPLGRFGKEVPTAQNAFDPAEKQFNR